MVTSIAGALALGAGTASGQVLGEQTTVLTAYVTEQATLSLPSRSSVLSFPSGRGGIAGSVGVKSHRGMDDYRNLRVTWSWQERDTNRRSGPVTSKSARLPLSGAIDVAARVPAPAEFPAGAAAVRVKVESFEF